MNSNSNLYPPRLAILAAISLILFSSFSLLHQLRSPRDFQKGLSFTGYTRDAYSGWLAEESMRNLKKTNAQWVSLLVTAYQDNVDSTFINYSSAPSPSDESVIHMISYAHQLGLNWRVFFLTF